METLSIARSSILHTASSVPAPTKLGSCFACPGRYGGWSSASEWSVRVPRVPAGGEGASDSQGSRFHHPVSSISSPPIYYTVVESDSLFEVPTTDLMRCRRVTTDCFEFFPRTSFGWKSPVRRFSPSAHATPSAPARGPPSRARASSTRTERNCAVSQARSSVAVPLKFQSFSALCYFSLRADRFAFASGGGVACLSALDLPERQTLLFQTTHRAEQGLSLSPVPARHW
jgi:hypothetical protein